MPHYSTRMAKLIAASVFAIAAAATPAVGFLYSAPIAHAEGGIPDPGPVTVTEPDGQQPADSAGCQSGESLNPDNGNCEPTTGDTTTTIDSGEPADLVPNINGDPCSGYWESAVCLTEDAPAVQPHSTISSSP